jgi:orotate phosphoribosyltransferase
MNPEIALRLFDEGAVLIDTERGFELKHHDMNPGAPRSPIRFNIRPPGTKDGKVSDELFSMIGHEMARIAAMHERPPTILVGVPHAGDVLVDSMSAQGLSFARMRLKKTEGAGVRRVTGILDLEGEFPGGRRNVAWLVDDLITKASSKIEALDITCAASFTVPVCLVCIDREQGGEQELKKYGVSLLSLFKMNALLRFYLDRGRLSADQYDAIMRYKALNE